MSDKRDVLYLYRRDSGLSRVLGSMTKLFSKNLNRSTDLLFLKSLVGSNACIQHEKALLVRSLLVIHLHQSFKNAHIFQEEEKPANMPVTHDSMRLIEQAKTICEQRIYLDEAKELYSLISSKWLHVSRKIDDQTTIS